MNNLKNKLRKLFHWGKKSERIKAKNKLKRQKTYTWKTLKNTVQRH